MVQLTQEQNFAIQFPTNCSKKRYMVIEAGAGAGKTFVLTRRIQWLLSKQSGHYRVPPSSLYVVTFTRMAAAELRERVLRLLQQDKDISPFATSLIHISTIDSLFQNLFDNSYLNLWNRLKTFSQEGRRTEFLDTTFFPYPKAKLGHSVPEWELLSESEAASHLKSLFQVALETRLRKDDQQALDCLDLILSGAYKTGYFGKRHTRENIGAALLDPQFLEASPQHMKTISQNLHPATYSLLTDLHRVAWKSFWNRLLQGTLTHSDITHTLHLLYCTSAFHGIVEDPAPPIFPQELIVDEYQDTNQQQHDILFKCIEKSAGRMVVVGDPKQSIYAFRGAKVKVFQSLLQDKHWVLATLRHNFRSVDSTLSHINVLSEHCFSVPYTSPSASFGSSDFCQEANLSRSQANALLPSGQMETKQPHQLTLLFASFDAKRLAPEEKEKFKILLGKMTSEFSLGSYLCWGLAQHLKSLQQKENAPWSQFAILTDKNKHSEKVAKELELYGIPCEVLTSAQTVKRHIERDSEVALLLCTALQRKLTLCEFVQILVSPLVFLAQSDLENFLFQVHSENTIPERIEDCISLEKSEEKSKDNNPFCQVILSAINLLESAQRKARVHFYTAWHELRCRLYELPKSPEEKVVAFDSMQKMNPFAYALISKFGVPFLRAKLQESFGECFLSEDLEHWNIQDIRPILERKEQKNSVQILTTHAAKGLEWKHVVVFPGQPSKHSLHFGFGHVGQDFYFKWLEKDEENLSLLDWSSHYTPEESGFLEEMKRMEDHFERQRLYYVAFTRAIETLTVLPFPGTWNARSSLIDKMKEEDKKGKKGKTEALYMETLRSFIRANFSLPLQGEESEEPIVLTGKSSGSQLVELSPQGWFNFFHAKQKHMELAQTAPQSPSQGSPHPDDATAQPHSLPPPDFNLPYIAWEDYFPQRGLDSQDGKSQKKAPSPLTTEDRQAKQEKGTLYHALREQGIFDPNSLSSIEKALMESAKFTLREFPILEKIVDNEEVSGKKRVMDAIYIVSSPVAGKILGHRLVSHTDTVIIYDYKTGEVKDEDFLQLDVYAGVMLKLLRQKSLKRFLPHDVTLKPHSIACLLDYSQQSDSQDSAAIAPPAGWNLVKSDADDTHTLFLKGLGDR